MFLYKKILEVIQTVKNPKNLQVLHEERGAIVMLTALLLPVLLGFTGFAYDIGNLYMHKSRLQNVADAAALAGGRAFLESQKKPTGTKDAIDETAGDGRAEEAYTIGGSKSRSGKHPDADTAADSYIYKNIVNLGTEVHSDKYSHFALNSTSNPTGASPKIFYRVGLYEDVPLYFLPVILDKKAQRVRAGAVVLVEKGSSGDGGGVVTTTTNPSIFDNLFTVSERFDANRSNSNHNTLTASFQGNIVYTYGNGQGTNANDDHFYQTRYEDSGSTDHLYETKDLENLNNTNRVNDPTINTFYNIEAYVDTFMSKLNNPHIDHIGPNLNDWKSITSDLINDTDSNLYKSEVFVPNWAGGGYRVWLGTNKQTPYINENGKFYAFDSTNDDYVYAPYNGNRYKVFFKNEGGWNPFITVNGSDIKLQGSDISNLTISEADKDKIRNINGENFDPQDNSRKYRKKIVSNIFHFDYVNGGHTIELTKKINKILPTDTDDTPIYVYVTGDTTPLTLKVYDTVRPVIIVYLGTGKISVPNEGSDKVFKGTIYAPFASYVGMNFTGTFYGSVITKNLEVPYTEFGSGGQGTANGIWISKNYLENYEFKEDGTIDHILYEDSEIKAVSDRIKNSIENSAHNDNPAIQAEIQETLKSTYETMLKNSKLDLHNISIDDMMKGTDQSKAWYKDLSYEDKQKLYKAWRTAYDDAPDSIKNLLWTWGNGLSVTMGTGSGSDGTNDVLRIINFRTEFRASPKDPFVDLSLDMSKD
ncbi:Putative Flp pilus-assembly TadE/G-like [Succiniclasticum ruminis]|uniref:Putative Flp pilus-assembly TadE/G-like n=1 Tax=Succiniclasticum ruminis TaxID=40841 RepID=A0A1G6I2N3_9FIRM|nr:Tad domain-containing protein [Succiniclasticum ruminis]SDC00787.1 Putative Flp pilus-assembly TadE/G-like [Succiniclasticum ruminis]